MAAPFPDRLGDAVEVRRVLDAELAPGPGSASPATERPRDVGLGEFLLRVLQVAGVAHVRDGRSTASSPRGSAVARRRDQLVGSIELASVDRPDRVGARADRTASRRQACSRAATVASNRLCSVAGEVVESQHAAATQARARRLAHAHDDVHAVALTEGAEPVEAGTGAPAAAFGDVPRLRVRGRVGHGVRRELGDAVPVRNVDSRCLIGEQQPHVYGEQSPRRRRSRPTRRAAAARVRSGR